MVRAAQKGELKHPSPKITQAAKSISAQDAHDFAATKHTGLPNKVAAFGAKLAHVELNPTTRIASKPSAIPHPPAIGQRKSGPLVPPATADAKMVMRMAPSVPNPIVPPAQSADPMPTMKTAKAIPLAPRYTAKGMKGKKTMPQPFANRTKTAVEFGAAMGAGRITKAAMGPMGSEVTDLSAGDDQQLPPMGGDAAHPVIAQLLAALSGRQPAMAGGMPGLGRMPGGQGGMPGGQGGMPGGQGGMPGALGAMARPQGNADVDAAQMANA